MVSPLISVIVPIYNTAEYLEQCLDTIVNQTFKDIEVICINDGSTDDSIDIIKKFSFKDNRLIVVNRVKASGSAALPRNIGLNLARGKYIMFLDSDDYFDLSMLEKLYAHAEKTGSDLVMCDNYKVSFITGEISDKETELKHKYLPKLETFSYKDIPDCIFQISNAAVWHKLILRETLLLHNLKFQLNVPILDDIYFVNLLLILSKRISIIRDRLVFYRSNRNGGQTSKIEKHKESLFLAFGALNKYLIDHSLYTIVKFSLQKWTLITMAWWLYSIIDCSVFYELYNLYKNEYFYKLRLMDINPDFLDNGLADFYNNILEREAVLPLSIILGSLVPGSKIAIYGAGKAGNYTYEIINTHGNHEIVIWCDKNADKFLKKIGTLRIKHPEELRYCYFDAIIIAIMDQGIVKEVKKYLAEMNVDVQKIYVIS